jgi:hypothetical protein
VAAYLHAARNYYIRAKDVDKRLDEAKYGIGEAAGAQLPKVPARQNAS